MKRPDKNLIIIGAGSLGVMTLDAALETEQYEKVYFIDDGKKKESLIHGYKVLGGLSDLSEIESKHYCFVIAIANNQVREDIANKYNLNYVNIIHPKTAISRFSNIGIGNIILSHTSIDPNVKIHNHVIMNKNNSLGHDSNLKSYSQVSPGCSLGGYTTLEEGVFLGLGSGTLPNIEIGKKTIVGAGAVVTKNLPDKVTAVGIPARIRKE